MSQVLSSHVLVSIVLCMLTILSHDSGRGSGGVSALADPGGYGHGHGHGHGHGKAGGTACIVKGSYCKCHYCKCEEGHVHCGYGGGYGKNLHMKFGSSH